ncbi:phytochromobilin:ferredoxin oxidoreductase [Striga asiatica]|uniref:Phytochromobilin:ferredoxin oxidoreductase n=1 Tax=Striga asiatica TaxID=4170 RepID=A0A5A7R445_STRAF|nr:phytochromobilin:ferredoxin oxidoreductase [Striga asiatica]
MGQPGSCQARKASSIFNHRPHSGTPDISVFSSFLFGTLTNPRPCFFESKRKRSKESAKEIQLRSIRSQLELAGTRKKAAFTLTAWLLRTFQIQDPLTPGHHVSGRTCYGTNELVTPWGRAGLTKSFYDPGRGLSSDSTSKRLVAEGIGRATPY